jgi:hypothetical protein
VGGRCCATAHGALNISAALSPIPHNQPPN